MITSISINGTSKRAGMLCAQSIYNNATEHHSVGLHRVVQAWVHVLTNGLQMEAFRAAVQRIVESGKVMVRVSVDMPVDEAMNNFTGYG